MAGYVLGMEFKFNIYIGTRNIIDLNRLKTSRILRISHTLVVLTFGKTEHTEFLFIYNQW